ncbi:MAG: transglutaminase family protein [Rhodoferax sp.]|nr:transglutaminase family protein [Rhodoferax sp.]
MRLAVTHETNYVYEPPVEVAQHMAYLRPRNSAAQQLLNYHLLVEPGPGQQVQALDVFGNSRTFISLQMPHERLRVVACSLVSTQAQEMPESRIAWEPVRERFRYRAEGGYDAAAEFVFASPYVPRHPDFAAYARQSFVPGASLFDAACDLMHRIHTDLAYDSQSTEVNTPALTALEQRKGVCQDFAHIMIACLRSLGLAARYVSGYLLTRPAPGAQRLLGSDASHAWVSVCLPDLPAPFLWCDFDPTNDRWGWHAPGEDYVVMAIGRDFADVSPIRGVIHGGANHRLSVSVTVEPNDPCAGAVGQDRFQMPNQGQHQSQSQGPVTGSSDVGRP